MRCPTAPSPRPARGRRLAAAGAVWIAALIAVLAALPATGAASYSEPSRLVFRPPVDAPVSDPFRPPSDPYGPGNRGIEYRTSPGDVVRAGASGRVSFAGAVAGSLYVTVDHGDSVVSSYSYLARISVRVGSPVAQGEAIGIAGERLFHFSVRVDGEYVDPAGFIGHRRVRVRLVPRWR